MDKIKIGQIGVGHAHAAGKMETYLASEDFEVVGVAEPDEKLRAAAANNPLYRDLNFMSRDELLNTRGLRAVAVETEVRDLLENAQACVDAGMHIHLDKPAGESLETFRHLLDTAARKHLAVQMGYMYRYNPAVTLLRDFLKRGWLGEPFELSAVMSKVVPAADRASLADYRGGIMFELGCHLTDLVVGLLGKPERVTPFARQAVPSDQLADNMLAVFEYPRAIATIKSSAAEVAGGDRRHLTLCGTEGTFHIQPLDKPSVRMAFSQKRGEYKAAYQTVDVGAYKRYVADAADLAAIIRDQKETDWPYDHDLAVQTALLTACGMS